MPFVSIIVPARDEALNIGVCLASLRTQTYPAFEIIVVDDDSSDNTPVIVREQMAQDARLRLIEAGRLPHGWAGKARALHLGATAAQLESTWLLFTDADTNHTPEALSTLFTHARSHNLDMLTTEAGNTTRSAVWCFLMPLGEQLTVETYKDVDQAGSVMAHGQYMLLRRALYNKSGGYSAIPTTTADDVDLANLLKKSGGRVSFVDGHRYIQTGQWATLPALWQGWRKSVYGAVRGNPALLLGAGMSFVAYGLVPVAGLAYGLRYRHQTGTAVLLMSVAAITGQIVGRRAIDKCDNISICWALTAPFGWVGVGAIFLDAARLALLRRGALWKGRAIPRPNARNS